MSKHFRKTSYNWIVAIGIVIIFTAAVWILFQNGGMIETSADHDTTVPFWHNWIISGGLILLIMVLPKRSTINNPFKKLNRTSLKNQSLLLILFAIIFTVLLLLIPEDSVFTYFPLIKLMLILIAPIVMFFYIKQSNLSEDIQKYSYLRNNTWLMPTVVTSAWITFYFFTPLGVASSTEYNMGFFALLLAALFSFLINSVLEELFYRVWLQTRLEALIGTWPAIIISSLLWAVWHMAIMGGDSYDIALSTVIVNHGVQGLFLGFLWAKYRNIWILIIIHGLINWPTQLITGFF